MPAMIPVVYFVVIRLITLGEKGLRNPLARQERGTTILQACNDAMAVTTPTNWSVPLADY